MKFFHRLCENQSLLCYNFFLILKMIWPEKILRDGKGLSYVLEVLVVGVFVAFSALLGQQHLPGSLTEEHEKFAGLMDLI